MHNDRRQFLKGIAIATAAGSIPAPIIAADGPSAHGNQGAQSRPAGVLATQQQAYIFFTPAEAAFVEAAVARLIPADELGQGAKEAGAAVFIDRQLAGAFGTMARNYRQGPWLQGTPQQGYQSRLTPQEEYRGAIREVNEQCMVQHGGVFAELGVEQQDGILHALEEGRLALESAPSGPFFAMLWDNTVEGIFADPMYGGNRDKIGWRLVGFPGVAAAYLPYIEKYDVPYRAQPVSIADVQNKVVQLDAHGHPVHVMLAATGQE